MTLQKIVAFAIGPIGAALLALISLPVITWFFTQEDVGRMAMLQVAIGFSTLLFSLGLDQAYVREFHEVTNKPALLKNVFLPGVSMLFVALLILLSLGGTLSYWLFSYPDLYLSLLIAIILLAALVSRFLSLVLRMKEHGLAFSMNQLVPKLVLLAVICGYVFLDADKNLTNLIFANSAAFILACIVLVYNTRKEISAAIKASSDFQHVKSMLMFGMPLIFSSMAFWGLIAVDKIFLRSFSGFEELGVYSVAVSFSAVAVILQSVFSTIWLPMVYKWVSKGEGLENVHKVIRYMLFLVVLIFCLAGMMSWIVTLFLPSSYSAVQWLVVSCLGYPLFYTLSETTKVGIGIHRKSIYSMLAALCALSVNLVGNWFMIPIFGAAGAAVSTCISFWVFFVLRTEFSIYLWKPMPRFLLYGYSVLVVIGASVFTLYGAIVFKFMFVFWCALLLITLFTFKSELCESLQFVKYHLSRKS